MKRAKSVSLTDSGQAENYEGMKVMKSAKRVSLTDSGLTEY